jgi:hypothetical protein
MKGPSKINTPRRFLWRSMLAAAGATVLTVGLAGHVSAAPLVSSVASASNFAGYNAAPTEGIASVSATFTIPTINCADDNDYFDQFGIDVDQSLYSIVQVACDGSGNASYGAILQVDGGTPYEPNPSVNRGDTVVVSVFQTTSREEAEIHDITDGTYWYDYGANDGALAGAFIGVLNNENTPQFTTVAFTKCQINGLYLNEEGPIQYNEKSGRTTLITAGRLSRPGDNFKLNFKNEA